jgi:catechol 2,3-dioxygenase-like lactoylglutathione lyase family enzyme
MAAVPRITSFAPQLLVDDLATAVAFYADVLGFAFGPPWGGFYAIGKRDGFEIHLKLRAEDCGGSRQPAPARAFGRLCRR